MRRIWLAVTLLTAGCGSESFELAPVPDVAEPDVGESEAALIADTGVVEQDTALETEPATDTHVASDAGADADATAETDIDPGSDAAGCDVTVLCYPDKDGDGFAPAGATGFLSCACPAGSTTRSPSITIDCNDEDPRVHPGATSFYPDPYCVPGTSCEVKSYDYNCNGVEERQYGVLTTCPSGCGVAGFPSALECGATGALNQCVKELVCTKKTVTARQGCH